MSLPALAVPSAVLSLSLTPAKRYFFNRLHEGAKKKRLPFRPKLRRNNVPPASFRGTFARSEGVWVSAFVPASFVLVNYIGMYILDFFFSGAQANSVSSQDTEWVYRHLISLSEFVFDAV